MSPTPRQITAQKIIEGYAKVRHTLKESERPIFDKVINLMEELSDIEDSSRLVALDSALVAGLMAINASVRGLSALILGETNLVVKLALLRAVEEQRGRRNSN